MINWISRTLALAIHDRQLSEHGGGSGVRDDGQLDSALARPQQLHAYGEPPPDLADLAASLAYGLARNQPFIDGNKRTVHICYRVFLRLNSADLMADDNAKYAAMIGLAGGTITEVEFAQWLRAHMEIQRSGEVQETKVRYR